MEYRIRDLSAWSTRFPARFSRVTSRTARVSYPVPVEPEELRARAGETALYRVRTRVSERKVSADSNQVSVDLYPVPQRIDDLGAKVTEKSIQLKWTPPNSTSAGAQLPPIQEFHVYRGELDPASVDAAQKDLHTAKWTIPPQKIGVRPRLPSTRTQALISGKPTRTWFAASLAKGAHCWNRVIPGQRFSLAKDTFPPSAPQDVVAAALPGPSSGTFVVDLSWTINLETDMAGYRVYRSESENVRGQLVTPDLLPTPSFRDSTVVSGHRYWYTVTAVDRAGNESAPSGFTLVEVP